MLVSRGIVLPVYARTVTDHHFGSANVSFILGKLIGRHICSKSVKEMNIFCLRLFWYLIAVMWSLQSKPISRHTFKKILSKFIHLMCTCKPCCTCGGQTTCRNWFSPSTMWILEIELRGHQHINPLGHLAGPRHPFMNEWNSGLTIGKK